VAFPVRIWISNYLNDSTGVQCASWDLSKREAVVGLHFDRSRMVRAPWGRYIHGLRCCRGQPVSRRDASLDGCLGADTQVRHYASDCSRASKLCLRSTPQR
jgi:hypothetical protein